MQINGVIAHNRVISADATNVNIHVIDNLGGANIFATMALVRCDKKDLNNGDFKASAFFSEFTDNTGKSSAPVASGGRKK